MKLYSYDGSFEGFLCAVATCLDKGDDQPEFIREGNAVIMGLFTDERIRIETQRDTALLFRSRFIEVVSKDAFATARYAYHSQKKGIDRLVFDFLLLGQKVGRRLDSLLTTEPVHSIKRIARHVSHEAHKYKGFVRFREVAERFLYAAIEPEADVLLLIAPHFVARIGDRPWMIHDLRRRQAVVFDLHSWRLIRDIVVTDEPACTRAEHAYAALWQRYFQHHAITERHNSKLQQKHVPLRYRKHLTEFTIP